VFLDGASEARIASATSDAVSNPDYTQQSLNTAFNEIDELADRNGWASEVTQLRKREAATEIHSGVIERLDTISPIDALEYLRENKGQMTGSEVERLEGILAPRVREHRGRAIGRRLAGGGAEASLGTRASNPAGGGITNISLDFNASTSGTARGTEVIIPDNATPAMRSAAELFNKRVVEFAAARGIDLPDRGVKTTSENGRGVANTIHVEPFFNTNIEFQKAIEGDFAAFAAIYDEAFGGLEGVRMIPPHGVGADRGAVSEVFDNETAFGRKVIQSILAGRSSAAGDVMALNQIADIQDPDERAAAMREFELHTGIRDLAVENERQAVQQDAFGMIESGGSIDDLPLSVRQGIGREQMSALRSYQNVIASGQKPVTDQRTYVELSDMAANDPDAFMQQDPMIWRWKLDNADFEFFVKKRSDILAGRRTPTEAVSGPTVSSIRSASSSALQAAGIDGNDEVAAFETDMLRWSDAFTATEGRKPTPLEMNDRINQRLVPLTINPVGFKRSSGLNVLWDGGKFSGAGFELDYQGDPSTTADDLTPADIRDERLTINGQTVSNENIELFASSYEGRFGEAPSVEQLVNGLVASGIY